MEALILIDLQNDFMPGGALAISDGDRVVPIANRLSGEFGLILATQDWHPSNHASFALNHPGRKVGDIVEIDGASQVLWPAHCVQGTSGAALVSELDVSRVTQIFRKGTDPRIDSYSAFFDNAHKRSTGLGDFLGEASVDCVYVMGLATDYCVLFSVLDARSLGFEVTVVEDGCRGVDLHAGDSERAFGKMRAVGARVISSAEVVSRRGGR